MSQIQCFWLELTDQIEMSLRRYNGRLSCNGPMGYHNGEMAIGRDAASNHSDLHGDVWPHDDPRWPQECTCGYKFTENEHWQFNPNKLYRRVDTGEMFTLANAPVGAMWDASWMRNDGEDGISLTVRTPGGDWFVDGPAKGCGFWTRTGTVPHVTANPSILMPTYHGWLRDGVLVEC